MQSLLRLVSLAFVFVLAQACEASFLYEDQPNESVAIFETVWQDIDENYSGFLTREPSWENVYATYRPRVTTETSESELWDLLTEMLDELNDEHVKLYSKEEFFVSGFRKAEQAASLFDLELIAKGYLTDLASPNNYILYGKMAGKENVGYLFIAAFLDENSEIIGSVLQQLDYRNLDALIIDLRTSIGGYDGLAAEYSSYFSDGRHHVYNSQFKNGPARDNFTNRKAFYTHQSGAISFSKPIILLTDAATASEAEIFTLNMCSFAHITQMGDTTAGALSTVGPARFLANGWRYEYSVQRITNPDGSSYEKMGIPPFKYVQNSLQDLQNGKDKVLEQGLQYLNSHFGI